MECLHQFLSFARSVHPSLQDGASRCLAYGYVACPLMWLHYSQRMTSHQYAYRLMEVAVTRVQALIDVSCVSGVDIIEDYAARPLTGQMLGEVDPPTAVSIWLLVLFQLFRSPVVILNAEFRRWRLKRNAGVASDEITTDRFLQFVRELLVLSSSMTKKSFSVCMKALVAINWQIPLRYSLESTEVRNPWKSWTLCCEDPYIACFAISPSLNFFFLSRYQTCAHDYMSWRKPLDCR